MPERRITSTDNEAKPMRFHTPEADQLKPILMGRKIVSASIDEDEQPPQSEYGRVDGTTPVGTLTLDDGTVLKVWGNDGGCACSAGCYYLESVAGTDNIITNVEVHEDPDGDDYEKPCPVCEGYWCEHREEREAVQPEGVYRIFVFHDDERINVAEFGGSDGNGYYGTGFHVLVSTSDRPTGGGQ